MSAEDHLVVFASLERIGPAALRLLLRGEDPVRRWRQLCDGSLRVPEDRTGAASSIVRWREQARRVDVAAIGERSRSFGVRVLRHGDVDYPSCLAGDPDAPEVLFALGDVDSVGAPRVAIVGTRKATGYGVRVAEALAAALCELGVSVVSGLALGIDAAAHRGALAAASSPPLAVVGAALDAPCPASNRRLAAAVAARGLVLSEVPVGAPSAPWRFPLRNRIVAAMSHTVVVVESAPSGGSLHTVRAAALDRDIPVLAVPGPIDAVSSEGTNRLIAEGASPCCDADDVMVALGLTVASRSARDATDERPSPSGDAARVLEALGWTPVSIAMLSDITALDLSALATAVADLEQAGWLRRSGTELVRCR